MRWGLIGLRCLDKGRLLRLDVGRVRIRDLNSEGGAPSAKRVLSGVPHALA